MILFTFMTQRSGRALDGYWGRGLKNENDSDAKDM